MPNKYNGKHLKLWTPATYRIEVEGDLDKSFSERLGGMRITRSRRENQTAVTTLEGRVRDQAELAGVMNSLYELHLPILSVQNLTENSGEAGHDSDKSFPSEPEREDST